jgi:two-component system, OmpR family, phosphate regulon sensor histidine kinase PhoR
MARFRADQKLFLSYLAVIAAVVVALTLGVASTLRSGLTERFTADLRRELLLARDVYRLSPGMHPDTLADQLGRLSMRRVTLIAPDGRVIGDSERDGAALARMENHAGRPEVRSARHGGIGQAVRVSASLRTELLYLAVTVPDGVVIRMAGAMSEIDASVGRVQRGILGVGLVALAMTGLLSLGFSLAITHPLRHILTAARAMSAGDLSARARLRGRDELGELGDVMNALAEELQRRLRQLEGERAEMQALIDSMAEAVIAWDAAGRVQRTNPAARSIFGLPADARGLAPEAVARRPAFLDAVRRSLNGQQVAPTELGQDGRQLLVTAQPLPGGGAVMVFLDVSELRRLEDVRRDFVANASHELKTPLTAIRGYSETLLDAELPPELRRQFAETVKDNADRLQRIVDDLLDLSRIESGGFVVQPEVISVAEVVMEALAPCRDALEAKGVAFTVEAAPDAEFLFADPAAVRQAINNLITNAVRYVPATDGRIAVVSRHLGRVVPGDARDWVEVAVGDNGTGIPSAHLPRIFERFYRADAARSRAEGGTGLGLAIVKHLVEAHGGTVEAESQLGAGTTIRLVLPAASEEGDPGQSPEGELPD